MNVDDPGFWSQAYREDRTAWNLRTPTPVFEHLLVSTPGWLADRLRPGRICIPCSGHGHDALLFSRHGWKVTAIDFAPEPLALLNEKAREERLHVDVLEADIFHLPQELEAHFDVVLEYTCVCAIDPKRRSEFVDAMARLLAPGGLFITLLFPIDGRPGGPPYAIDEGEFTDMMSARFTLLHAEFPDASVRPRRDRERLQVWKLGYKV